MIPYLGTETSHNFWTDCSQLRSNQSLDTKHFDSNIQNKSFIVGSEIQQKLSDESQNIATERAAREISSIQNAAKISETTSGNSSRILEPHNGLTIDLIDELILLRLESAIVINLNVN